MSERSKNTKTHSPEAARAALLSAVVIPGAGQMYNRQWVKGFFIAVIFTIASLCLLIPVSYAFIVYFLGMSDPNPASFNPAYQDANPFTLLQEQQLSFITLLVISVALYVYSVVDAYRFRKNRT